MAAELDHVVLLLPYDIITTPPAWLTDIFTISAGGVHADGKTENRLVLFQDGTYLELISFVNDDPQKRQGHHWDKPYGVVDFAFTTKDANFSTLPAIKARLSETGTGIAYANPQEGGRLKPDGSELRWRVTFPTGTPRGSVPFWCHDVTPRERRVPITPESSTHPSGAVGMAGVQLKVPESSVLGIAKATAAIVDSDLNNNGRYEIGVPHDKSTYKPSVRIETAGPDENNGQSLALVIRTSRDHPNLHRGLGDGMISVLFEKE